MNKKIRQCCGDVCNNNTHCEEDAWRRYQKQRMEAYKRLLSNKLVQGILVFLFGFIIGKIL